MKILNYFFVFIGLAGLVGVRILEENLFYDPFLAYFHDANENASFPNFEWGSLALNYLFRFGLNVIFSLLIVHFLFRKIQWTVQALVMMGLVFVVTFPAYLLCINDRFEVGYLFSFYMRRFVIQPLIVLLIVPLFYYRKSQLKN